MEPTRKTYTKTVNYWDCGYGHRHKDKQVATRCKKKNSVKDLRKLDRIAIETRNHAMVEHWLQCNNFKETANYFNLSYGWTKDVIQSSKEYYRHIGSEWAYGMDLTALRELKKRGINSFSETRDLFVKRFLYPEYRIPYKYWEKMDLNLFEWHHYIKVRYWLLYNDKINGSN